MKSQEQINKIEAVVLYILQHFKEGLDYIKLFKSCILHNVSIWRPTV